MWALTQRWYRDRLGHDPPSLTTADRQAILADVGLVGDFWQLA